MTEADQSREAMDPVVAAATGGDDAAFSELAHRHRRELQVHCHRMLGSFEDSEDLVQETFLRAWRGRTSFEGRSSYRAWLHRIATNACHDALKRRSRRPQPAERSDGRLLEEILATDAGPEAAVISKETSELAFMATIQHLPPKQRAVLILRSALGLSAKEAARLLGASVPSVNSALQRARHTMKHRLPEQRLQWVRRSDEGEDERALLRRYLQAIERADAEAFVEEMLSDTFRPSGAAGGRRAGLSSCIERDKEGACEAMNAQGQISEQMSTSAGTWKKTLELELDNHPTPLSKAGEGREVSKMSATGAGHLHDGQQRSSVTYPS